jgi:hypothetical protein
VVQLSAKGKIRAKSITKVTHSFTFFKNNVILFHTFF